uniref:Uncharacterized protein n=1 Tax=Anguilla anguilla TaxID=7936 RepID=A0A0E9R8S3_ANGAN
MGLKRRQMFFVTPLLESFRYRIPRTHVCKNRTK